MLGLLTKMKSWAFMTLAAVAVIVGAYTVGSRQARRSLELDAAKRTIDATRKAKKVKRDVEMLSDDDILSEFDKLYNNRRR